jgi:proline iminopeptidase
MKITSFFFSLLLTQFAVAQTEDSIITHNAVLHYYQYGKGVPLVILSGGPGIASHQEDDLAMELSKKYKTILFDQRGTGKSWTKPLDTTTININVFVEDIELLRKHLHLQKLNLTGHSWGAILATAYTAKYPQHVNSVILIGPGEPDKELNDIVNDNIDIRFQLSDTTKWHYWNDPVNIAKDSAKASYEIRKLNWSVLIYDRSKIDAIMQQASHGAFNKTVNLLMWKDMHRLTSKQFSSIRQLFKGKSMILFGWQDPIALTCLSAYEKIFPKALVKGISKCGHMPSVEQPELFYTALFDFFKTAIH